MNRNLLYPAKIWLLYNDNNRDSSCIQVNELYVNDIIQVKSKVMDKKLDIFLGGVIINVGLRLVELILGISPWVSCCLIDKP